MSDFFRRPPLGMGKPRQMFPQGDGADQGVPTWAASDDFTTFERNADALASGAVYRRDALSPAERALGGGRPVWNDLVVHNDDRPSLDPVRFEAPAVQPSAADAAARRRAEAVRQGIFNDFDKHPDREIDAGRWFREKAFGAKPDTNNIEQDKVGLYDPQFSATLREALRKGTPAEVDFINDMRSGGGGRYSLFTRRLTLKDGDKTMFINMMERAGPNGQKVAQAARAHWGISK